MTIPISDDRRTTDAQSLAELKRLREDDDSSRAGIRLTIKSNQRVQVQMAVDRVEWVCPGCRRKYAIPSSAPKPAMCPSCQDLARSSVGTDGVASAQSQMTPPVRSSTRPVPRPAVSVKPAVPFGGGLPDFAAAMEQEAASESLPDFDDRVADETPTSLSIAALPGKQFHTLEKCITAYRALAAMLALGAVSGLLYAIYAAVSLKDAADRNATIGTSVAIFIGAALLAGLHFVVAELIRVALAIEERTR